MSAPAGVGTAGPGISGNPGLGAASLLPPEQCQSQEGEGRWGTVLAWPLKGMLIRLAPESQLPEGVWGPSTLGEPTEGLLMRAEAQTWVP